MAKRVRTEDGEGGRGTELAEGTAVPRADTAEAEEEEEVVDEGKEESVEGGKVRGLYQRLRVLLLAGVTCTVIVHVHCTCM